MPMPKQISIAKVTDSMDKVTNSIAKATNSIANGTNSIAKTCNNNLRTFQLRLKPIPTDSQQEGLCLVFVQQICREYGCLCRNKIYCCGFHVQTAMFFVHMEAWHNVFHGPD